MIRYLLPVFIFSLWMQKSFSQYAPLYNITVNNELGVPKKFPMAGGFNNPQFSAVDLNGDGVQDLFVFDRSGNEIYTFINGGTLNTIDYSYAPEYESHFPVLANWALLVDYNCDGAADIFTYTNYPAAGIKVYDGYYDENNTIQFSLKDSLLVWPLQGNDVNLYVSSVDIPAIVDVNGDGDMDVLTFQITGGYVMYFENTSKETGNGCDALTFKLEDNCWGDFFEGGFKREDSLNVPCPFMSPVNGGNNTRGDDYRHSGSTLLSFDNDGDGDKELITGDISWSNLVYLHNNGDVTNSHVDWQDTLFPSYNTPADVFIFPAPFWVDIDNDGLKDLLVSPNAQNGAQNYSCVWYYKNEGTSVTADFNYQTNTLFIDDMIDVGEGAYPVFFDADNDGLKDLLIGNYGYFDQFNPNVYQARISYYRNIGDATHPAFQLITDDYANLSALSLKGICPTFGDLDGDGDMDMITGRDDGSLLYFQNTAGPGAPANFVFMSQNYAGIDVGNFSTPQLVDANNDGLLDLIIGERDGNLNYYQNTGTTTNPVFTVQSTFFGGVDVRQPGFLTGYSVPFLAELEPGQGRVLLVGSERGFVYRYTNVDNNLSGTFTKADSVFSGVNVGLRAAVSGADMDDDGKTELIVGTYRGGVLYYDQSSTIGVNEIAANPSIHFYPNPASGTIKIEIPPMLKNSALDISVINCFGELVSVQHFMTAPGLLTMDLSNIPNGLYLVKVSNHQYTSVGKVLVSH